MINAVLPLSSKNQKLFGVESSQKQWGGITGAGRVMQKHWDLCTAPPGKKKKKSCKVLTRGTGRAAEGVETNEMESLQRKFVFYYLYYWTGIGKKRFQQANDDVIQRFQKEFAGEEMMLEQKQHISITVAIISTRWNSCNQDFFMWRMFLAFSLFSQGVFSSVTFVEHLIINLSRLKSCWAVTGEKHKPGTCLPLSKIYIWGSF